MDDCFAAAYEDLTNDGRLDFDHDEDLVTKDKVVALQAALDGALDRTTVLETRLHTALDWCEFDWDNCSSDAFCTDSDTGFTCDCVLGMTGNGVTCSVDPEASLWQDAATGLVWQKDRAPDPLTFDDAAQYCATLDVDDVVGWRLPTIDELRSIVRNCPETMPGGACRVTDTCANSSSSCWTEDCNPDCGLGSCGSFRAPALEGSCLVSILYWSSTLHAPYDESIWGVQSYIPSIYRMYRGEEQLVRCVHDVM